MRLACVARQINDHPKWGKLVIWPTLAMWVLAVALVLMSRRDRKGGVVTVVAVLALLAAGDRRRCRHPRRPSRDSTAVWSCTIGSDACG